jgi:signal transduction histidine kinase
VADRDSFLQLATRELRTAATVIKIYVALLDLEIAANPGLDPMREVVRALEDQADLVTRLVDASNTAA